MYCLHDTSTPGMHGHPLAPPPSPSRLLLLLSSPSQPRPQRLHTTILTHNTPTQLHPNEPSHTPSLPHAFTSVLLPAPLCSLSPPHTHTYTVRCTCGTCPVATWGHCCGASHCCGQTRCGSEGAEEGGGGDGREVGLCRDVWKSGTGCTGDCRRGRCRMSGRPGCRGQLGGGCKYQPKLAEHRQRR